MTQQTSTANDDGRHLRKKIIAWTSLVTIGVFLQLLFLSRQDHRRSGGFLEHLNTTASAPSDAELSETPISTPPPALTTDELMNSLDDISEEESRSPTTRRSTSHIAVYLVTVRDTEALRKFANLPTAEVDVISVCFDTRCDATALSTPETPLAHEMETHHYPGSTWTESRNRLYRLAMRKEEREGKTYLYYVFMDQDYVPSLASTVPSSAAILKASEKEEEPASSSRISRREWTYFERLLVDYLPALASPSTVTSPVPFGNEEVTLTYYIDAAVNAFHRDALPILLPYSTFFDDADWTASQGILLLRMRCVFGSVVQLNGIIWAKGTNGKPVNDHSKYPMTGDPMTLAASVMGQYLPEELHGMTWPILSAPRNGAVAPYIPKKANWLSAVPPACWTLTMQNIEHKGYDP